MVTKIIGGKVMDEVLTYIKNKNNITEEFLPSKSGFNGNRVFLSENFVIKLFEEKDNEEYENELIIYQNIKKDYVAKLIDTNKFDCYKYLLISRLKAKSLYSIWHTLDYRARENVVKQIAEILKAINFINVRNPISFKKFLKEEYYNWYSRLQVSIELKEKINNSFEQNIKYINDNELVYIVFFDNHFDNFLYDGEKVYAIDFEDIKIGSLDYQLDIWNRMSKYPKLFANEEDEKNINAKDYSNLTQLIRKYYPEMFAISNLEERLRLYSLTYDVKILVKYSLNENQLMDRLNEDMKGDILK
jgi:hypothetical protein